MVVIQFLTLVKMYTRGPVVFVYGLKGTLVYASMTGFGIEQAALYKVGAEGERMLLE